MRLDRRQFIQIGAIAAFAGSGCDSSKPNVAESSSASAKSGAAGPALEIDFEGLYLIEEKGSSMVVHLFDAPAVGLPAHTPQMQARESQIDQTKTAKPDAAHIIPAGTDNLWLWDLQGMKVVGPASSTGAADLTTDPSSSEDSLEVPTADAGWHSPARLPDLRVLSGATKITKYQAFSSSITLTHGHLGVLKPTDVVGPVAVWLFTDPAGKPLMRRALSNKVRYSCPTTGTPLTVQVGSQSIVFKAGAAAQVSVTNLPTMRPGPCGSSCTPNMHHFSAFLQVVDAQVLPTVGLAAPFAPAKGHDAGADYCPGGRI